MESTTQLTCCHLSVFEAKTRNPRSLKTRALLGRVGKADAPADEHGGRNPLLLRKSVA